MTVHVKSPAKINLHLEILNKRKDGYHNLISIVQLVALYDEIEIKESRSLSDCIIKDDSGIMDNIIIRAVECFRKYTGIKKGLLIELKKGIPIGAGLGGGYSNAAAIILGLNKLFGTTLKNTELIELAAELGSDVPLFIRNPASIIKGRGEIIEPIRARNDFKTIIVYPGFSISSKNAYDLWDAEIKHVKSIKHSDYNIKKVYENEKIENWQFFNSFGAVIDRKYTVIKDIKHYFKKEGALYAEITGSGSAVIAVFPLNTPVSNIIIKLKQIYSLVQLIKMLDRSIKPVLK